MEKTLLFNIITDKAGRVETSIKSIKQKELRQIQTQNKNWSIKESIKTGV